MFSTLILIFPLTWFVVASMFGVRFGVIFLSSVVCFHPLFVSTSFTFHVSITIRHNERDSVSNHLPRDCLLNLLFRRTSKKTSKLRVTGLCVGTSPVTGEFPAQMAMNAENVSIWWRHYETVWVCPYSFIQADSVFHGGMFTLYCNQKSPHPNAFLPTGHSRIRTKPALFVNKNSSYWYRVIMPSCNMWPLLLTWYNLNPCMDK